MYEMINCFAREYCILGQNKFDPKKLIWFKYGMINCFAREYCILGQNKFDPKKLIWFKYGMRNSLRQDKLEQDLKGGTNK